MRKTTIVCAPKTEGVLLPVQKQDNEEETYISKKSVRPDTSRWARQVVCFGLIGSLNTLVDLLILNSLLWFFPSTSTLILLGYNAVAFSIGAVNSFLLNKYWTFQHTSRTTPREVLRFLLATLCGIGWNTLILWLASTIFHPVALNTALWTNASKGFAIASGALLSYLGMRLWVFVYPRHTSETHDTHEKEGTF